MIQLEAIASLAAQGFIVTVFPGGGFEVRSPDDKRSPAARRQSAYRERIITKRNETSQTATNNAPSPSLSFPPAPPLSPSPTPPSPHAPTPTHPHPPTHVREEALALEIEERPKPDRFDEFWKLYPRKVAKDKAREKWDVVKPELVDTILAAVALQSKSRDWLKNDGQFIPHAATWLHNCRWEDELKPALMSDVQAVDDDEELGFLTNDAAIFHK